MLKREEFIDSVGGISLKTKLFLLIAGIGMLSMTGCASTLKITDTQSDMVAEYAAGLVLKYDRYYEDEYIEPTIMVEEVVIPSVSTPTPTVAIASTDNKSSNGKTLGTSQKTEENLQANADFTEVIGIKGLSIEYSDYEIRENLSDPYFTIESGEGKKLLIVTFSVKNTTSKDVKLNLENADIEYQLDIENGTFQKPLLTFLENDLRLIDTVIKAKSTIETVLVFNVSDDINVKNVNAIISQKDKTAIVKLK